MTLLLVITFLTLFISGMCSLFEAVLYSTRIGTIEAVRRKSPGDPLAAKMIELKRNISRPLAAILVLNTIANTAGATFAGVVSARVLPSQFVPVYTCGLVAGILIFSEILPKTYGAIHWRKMWRMIALPLLAIKTLLYPAVALSQRLTTLMTHRGNIPTVTEDEILAIVQLGASEGHITHGESQLVRNIIQMEDILVRDIMTPRIVMFTMDEATSVADALTSIQEVGFTRIPIYRQGAENITGYVLCQDVYRALAEGASLELKSLSQPITFVPESANCLSLLNQFLKSRLHLAMVTDEYGGLAGLVALEDLIETLLGSEIVDETDQAIDMRSKAKHLKESGFPSSPPKPSL